MNFLALIKREKEKEREREKEEKGKGKLTTQAEQIEEDDKCIERKNISEEKYLQAPTPSSNVGSKWSYLSSSILEFHPHIESFRIGTLPNIYYIPDIISLECEQHLIDRIEEAGKGDVCVRSYQSGNDRLLTAVSRGWTRLKTRKLLCFTRSEEETPEDMRHGLTDTTFPDWLNAVVRSVAEVYPFIPNKNDDSADGNKPSSISTVAGEDSLTIRPTLETADQGDETTGANHVLINRYESGQGILHHTDGPRYIPRVAILSLESCCQFSFRRLLASDQIGVADNPSTHGPNPNHGSISNTDTDYPTQGDGMNPHDKDQDQGQGQGRNEGSTKAVFPFPPKVERDSTAREKDVLTLSLARRSLLLFDESAYTCHMHGIDPDHTPVTERRTSLTLRRMMRPDDR